MTSELRRRLLITLAALGGAWVLRYILVPGVHIPGVFQLLGSGDVLVGTLGRATLGHHAIQSYVAGSVLATLLVFLRAPGSAAETRPLPAWIPREPWLALVLGLVISAGHAFGVAIYLENVGTGTGAGFVDPGAVFRLTMCVSSMAGTALTVGLAWLVSSRGIGNGALLLLGLDLVDSGVHALRASSRLREHYKLAPRDPADMVFLVVLVVVGIAAATAWLNLRWTLGDSGAAGERTADAPRPATVPAFHVSGVGLAGLNIVVVFLGLPASAAIWLPSDHPLADWAIRFSSDDPIYLFLYVLLGAGATFVIAAWAYDAATIRRTLAIWPDLARQWGPLIEDERYEHRLRRVTMLPALGLPLACAVFSLAARKAEAAWLSPISLFVLTATVLDSSRQWRLHRSMALGPEREEHDARCGRCGCPVSSSDPYCAGCGVVSSGEPKCAEHPLAPAVARCLICHRVMCDDCTQLSSERAVCQAHVDVKLVEGWAVVEGPATELEAVVAQARLASRQIEAVVLANTYGPAYGSLGVFQVLPAVPLLAHSRCGGGGIQVLVRPTDWVTAREVPVEDPAPAV